MHFYGRPTLENTIEPKVVLLAAEKIRTLGIARDGKYVYRQISLEISYDGYTVTLSNPTVSLSLFFHNKVKATYKRMSDLESFYQSLKNVAAE